MHAPAIEILDPFQPAREMHDTVRRDHFARVSKPAKARRDIERRAAVTAIDRDGFARIDPDSYPQR